MKDLLARLRHAAYGWMTKPEHPDKALLLAAESEIQRLRAEAAAFHMQYRMKCDEDTKRLHVEWMRMRAELRRTAIALRGPEPPDKPWPWHDLPERVEALQAALKRSNESALAPIARAEWPLKPRGDT